MLPYTNSIISPFQKYSIYGENKGLLYDVGIYDKVPLSKIKEEIDYNKRIEEEEEKTDIYERGSAEEEEVDILEPKSKLRYKYRGIDIDDVNVNLSEILNTSSNKIVMNIKPLSPYTFLFVENPSLGLYTLSHGADYKKAMNNLISFNSVLSVANDIKDPIERNKFLNKYYTDQQKGILDTHTRNIKTIIGESIKSPFEEIKLKLNSPPTKGIGNALNQLNRQLNTVKTIFGISKEPPVLKSQKSY